MLCLILVVIRHILLQIVWVNIPTYYKRGCDNYESAIDPSFFSSDHKNGNNPSSYTINSRGGREPTLQNLQPNSDGFHNLSRETK